MHVIFNQCLRLNFSKALFTVFLFTIIETLLSMIPLSVAMNSASAPENAATAGSSSVLSVLFSFVITLALCIVLFMMLYGMFCVTARMVQKQKVTVGWLFIALIKKDKKVLGASAILHCAWLFGRIPLFLPYGQEYNSCRFGKRKPFFCDVFFCICGTCFCSCLHTIFFCPPDSLLF